MSKIYEIIDNYKKGDILTAEDIEILVCQYRHFALSPKERGLYQKESETWHARVLSDQREACSECHSAIRVISQGPETIWCHLHYDHPYFGAIGGGVTWQYTHTSIGTAKKVIFGKGTKWEKAVDLTDYDCW